MNQPPELNLSASALLADHGIVPFIDAETETRRKMLDWVSELAWELCPRAFTAEQRGRVESYAENAAVAGRDVELAIVSCVALIEAGALTW